MLDRERAGFDSGIRPQDDLWGHVNQRWLRETEIPPDLHRWGVSTANRRLIEEQVHALVQDTVRTPEAAGTNGAKIAALYRAFMDEDAVEAAAAEPVQASLARVRASAGWADLAEVLGRLDRETASVDAIGWGPRWTHGPFVVYVDADDRDPTRCVANLEQGGLMLPDESYYREERFAEMRGRLAAYLERLLALVDWPDPHRAAARVLELETELASGHWSAAASRDRIATYNRRTRDDLEAAAPFLDWGAWLTGLGADPAMIEEVVLRQPGFLTHLAAVAEHVPWGTWQAWTAVRVVDASAPFLARVFVEEHFAHHGRGLSGLSELPARWQRAVGFVQSSVGEAVGELYVERHFPPGAKTVIQELVAALVEAYRRSIAALDWLGEQTRARALAKLATLRVKVGYPDRFRDYSGLDLPGGPLAELARAAGAFETDRELAKVGSLADREEWFMPPQVVDAYFNPSYNEICFPAGILTPPAFDPDADPADNFGAIGSVIGHEIGHCFDDQGSLYDEHGVMTDWWTDADRASFRARTGALVAQYAAFEPRDLPGEHLDGELTLGENIGDLGGIGIAVQAYLISREADRPSEHEKAEGVRRLLLNYALAWRSKWRPEALRELIATDPHSPSEFRGNVVRNLDVFHEVFATRQGDGLWLDPGDRVRIW